jgi:hypothetical protein
MPPSSRLEPTMRSVATMRVRGRIAGLADVRKGDGRVIMPPAARRLQSNFSPRTPKYHKYAIAALGERSRKPPRIPG